MSAARVHWHALHNVAGYLPEDDDAGYVFGSFGEARDSLIDDMETARASLDYAEESPELARVAADLGTLIDAARETAGNPDGWLGYGATSGGANDLPTAWQVVACNHAECGDPEE